MFILTYTASRNENITLDINQWLTVFALSILPKTLSSAVNFKENKCHKVFIYFMWFICCMLTHIEFFIKLTARQPI